jgi:hypothetical protein
MSEPAALVRAVRLALAGDWDAAHEVAQADAGRGGAWVHAWLHRVEGDLANARYWYARADRPVGSGAVDAEGQAILQALEAEAAGSADQPGEAPDAADAGEGDGE